MPEWDRAKISDGVRFHDKSMEIQTMRWVSLQIPPKPLIQIIGEFFFYIWSAEIALMEVKQKQQHF